ncbi:hypothetical protein FOCC_FOCC007470 [Frankliniella occidentalis]|nr:hypothetical protein FOCC_FOCC007470 [Frankliniella occidentalis]
MTRFHFPPSVTTPSTRKPEITCLDAIRYIPAEPFDDAHGSENPGENSGNDDEPGVPDNDSCSTASSKAEEDGVYGYDQIVENIAHFYAMLEGKYIVPSSTVNALASKLSFLTEIVQDKLRRDLTKSLTSVGLSADVITDVIRSVVSMDPLYNCHHKNAPGECFLTKALRQTYYKNHFKYQEPVQINLRRDQKNTEDTIQYVDIKESLRLMLEDPSVQKVVDRSFNIPPSDGSVYANYTDGSVYRESGTPQKRIDILLYMDAYNCANPLGSAKNKHKTNGMYMTLGNLDPYMRAFLKAMRLVMVLNEKALKKTDVRYRKCFEALLKDLKILERDGFLYKEERIDVRVQFFQGDHLGQNGIGGFVESFSASHYCRFCDLSKIDYKTNCKLDIPQFPVGNWRTPESFNRDLRTKLNSNVDHEAGVKRNSPFNQLDHFHVCDPRLPPCLGHDLFIDGVVDNDLASIIRGMIGKGWFTEEGLNMRIRGFKYKGRDARNKPAPYKMTKKKLGGHAIQNWTLCRLLPFLIGDWVKTDHKLWKLYLLLKRTIELVCAPALTADQVELMGVRIKKYMRKRKILPNNYKPKHHFFSHYKDLFLKFGPLIHMWTMAFEHRHQYFKRVSQICRNFINLNKLLARKFQLLMAYQSMGQLFPDRPVFSNTSPLEYENENQELKDFLMSLNLPEESEVVESLVLNDIKHKPGEFLLLSGTGGDIILGQVEMIIFDGNTCRVVVEKYKTSWWQEYSIYYVQESIGFGVVLFEELENPCPHSIYEFMEYSCFSLRHDMKD